MRRSLGAGAERAAEMNTGLGYTVPGAVTIGRHRVIVTTRQSTLKSGVFRHVVRITNPSIVAVSAPYSVALLIYDSLHK